MAGPYITLDQWRALITVVDSGGYAQAAEVLHKSQSSVTYAVQKLQSQLERAVKREAYEEAARIRDEIKRKTEKAE